jgi:hypothetical protein
MFVLTALTGCGGESTAGSSSNAQSAASPPGPTQSAKGMVDYRNSIVGWSIQHPADWTVNDQNPEQVFLVSPAGFGSEGFQENVNVFLAPLRRRMSLAQYARGVPSLPGVESYEELSSDRTTAGALDYPAWETHVTYTYQGGRIEGLQTVIILPTEDIETARILTFTATPDSYDDTLPTAQAMVDSFKIW